VAGALHAHTLRTQQQRNMDRLLAASGLKPHRPELKPPDCIARYVVVKHSWRGKYKRIVCITPTALYTQNPEGRLVLTNSYVFAAGGDSDIESVALGGDDQEFTLGARQDGKVRAVVRARRFERVSGAGGSAAAAAAQRLATDAVAAALALDCVASTTARIRPSTQLLEPYAHARGHQRNAHRASTSPSSSAACTGRCC